MWRWLANALLAVLACTRWRDRAEMVGESIASIQTTVPKPSTLCEALCGSQQQQQQQQQRRRRQQQQQ